MLKGPLLRRVPCTSSSSLNHGRVLAAARRFSQGCAPTAPAYLGAILSDFPLRGRLRAETSRRLMRRATRDAREANGVLGLAAMCEPGFGFRATRRGGRCLGIDGRSRMSPQPSALCLHSIRPPFVDAADVMGESVGRVDSPIRQSARARGREMRTPKPLITRSEQRSSTPRRRNKRATEGRQTRRSYESCIRR